VVHHVLDLLGEVDEPAVLVLLSGHVQHVVEDIADHLNLLLGLLVIIDVADSLVCRALVLDLGISLLHLAQDVVHTSLDLTDVVLHV
jgi:hypothetical protein